MAGDEELAVRARLPYWPGRIEPGLSPCQLRRPLRVDTASLRSARTAGSTGSKEISPAFNLGPVGCRGLLDEKAAVPSVLLLLGESSRRLGPEGLSVTRRKKGRVGWAGTVARLAWSDRARLSPCQLRRPSRVDTASLRSARTAGSTGGKEISPAFKVHRCACRGLWLAALVQAWVIEQCRAAGCG